MKEYVVTVHGIATEGKWQEELRTAFAPHFECISTGLPPPRETAWNHEGKGAVKNRQPGRFYRYGEETIEPRSA